MTDADKALQISARAVLAYLADPLTKVAVDAATECLDAINKLLDTEPTLKEQLSSEGDYHGVAAMAVLLYRTANTILVNPANMNPSVGEALARARGDIHNIVALSERAQHRHMTDNEFRAECDLATARTMVLMEQSSKPLDDAGRAGCLVTATIVLQARDEAATMAGEG